MEERILHHEAVRKDGLIETVSSHFQSELELFSTAQSPLTCGYFVLNPSSPVETLVKLFLGFQSELKHFNCFSYLNFTYVWDMVMTSYVHAMCDDEIKWDSISITLNIFILPSP